MEGERGREGGREGGRDEGWKQERGEQEGGAIGKKREGIKTITTTTPQAWSITEGNYLHSCWLRTPASHHQQYCTHRLYDGLQLHFRHGIPKPPHAPIPQLCVGDHGTAVLVHLLEHLLQPLGLVAGQVACNHLQGVRQQQQQKQQQWQQITV